MQATETFAMFCLFVAIGTVALVVDSGSLCSILIVVPGIIYAAVLTAKLEQS